MAKNVLVSQGTSISIKSGNAFIKIAGITDFSGIDSGSATIIDTTDLDSVSKEKLMGVPDAGSIKLDMNYMPADPGQLACEAARAAGALASFKIVAGGNQWVYDAYVPTFDKSGGVDKQWTASMTHEVSGPITKSAVTA